MTNGIARRRSGAEAGDVKVTRKHALVLVTTPDIKTARALAQAALEERLIACANLVPRVESHYRWQGKLERSAEVLMLMKTPAARLAALERFVLARHPYDTPEFIVLPITRGSRGYLEWLEQATH